nr:medium-chain acyl-CoA ligase ACSF2, mitochondrial-like isoform X1 [Pocillopora verrucosa]
MWLKNTKPAAYFRAYLKRFVSTKSCQTQNAVRDVRDFDSRRSTNKKLTQSYYHGTSLQPLLGYTIGQMFDKTVEKFPDREAYVFCEDGDRATFSQFQQEVDQLAEGLISRGLTKGDRLGIWAPNIREWLITQLAAAQIGLILVCLNTAYQGPETEYVLRKAGCKAVVMVDEFRTENFYDTMTRLIPELPHAKPGELQSERLPELKDVFVVSKSKKSFRGTTTFEELLYSTGEGARNQVNHIKSTLQFDEPACLQFTSGTTGRPKGVTMNHHALVNNAFLIGQFMNYSEPSRICNPWPLFHSGGVTVTSLVNVVWGVSVVYPSRGYNSTAILKAVQEEKCDTLYGTPPMVIDILAHPELKNYDLSSLRKGLFGATSCPEEVMRQAISKLNLKQLTVAYGLTETGPLVTQTPFDDPLERKVTTVGKVYPHTEMKIVDFKGNIVPVNTPGEICIRGYSVMMGYWGEEEETEDVIEPSRWFHSGDLGTMDERGYVRIVGRLKDVIMRGGENVYPAEIEYFLHTHPKIQDAQIISVPDERLGEEVCAWIKLRAGETMSAGEVKDFCKDQIAYFKIPRYIKFVDDYPMTASGKVMKYVMREQAKNEYKFYAT